MVIFEHGLEHHMELVLAGQSARYDLWEKYCLNTCDL